MYPRSVRALQADALFVSVLQRGDEPNASQIWRAVTAALTAYGGAGCAERVAQEFGDHPETAAVRMRWARDRVSDPRRLPARRWRRRRRDHMIRVMFVHPAYPDPGMQGAEAARRNDGTAYHRPRRP